jgi:oxazoline/thiazoline dehydrogenase
VSMLGLAPLPYLLAFRNGVTLTEKEGSPVVQWDGRIFSLRALSKGALSAIEELSSGSATAVDLVARVLSEGVAEQAMVLYCLDRFKHLGILTYTAASGGQKLATLSATSRAKPVMPGEVTQGARYGLSRFACLRREGACLLLESPLGHATTRLFDPRAAALCHLLVEPRTLVELCRATPTLAPEETAMLLGLLLGSHGAVIDEAPDEVQAGALEAWSFHDLVFHARSRKGRHIDRYGATFPSRGRMEPLPAVKSKSAGPVIPLKRPSIAALLSRDASLTRVLEGRRSIRAYDNEPICVDHVAELLYRSARVCALYDASEKMPYAFTERPYPSAGSCYSLEVYLAVATCAGLDPGLYHYDPLAHDLTTISPLSRAVAGLLDGARDAMAGWAPPIQTVVVLAARFQRLTYKYESIAYSSLLKEVGALYQTMYLVATDMGLAPCALGGGDSDLFAEAAGLNYYEETSVGEFALGSRSGGPARR